MRIPSLKNLTDTPSVAIIYLTYNRLYYTQKTLPALLDSSKY